MGNGYQGFDPDDDLDDQLDSAPQGLRKHVKSLERQLKALQDAASEKDATIAQLTTATRGSTIKDILVSKGVNPKVQSLIPDSVDATEEAVLAFVEAHKDVLGPAVTPVKPDDAPPDQSQLDPHLFNEAEEDEEAAEIVRQYQLAQAALGGATPNGPSKNVGQVLDDIGKTSQSFEETARALAQVQGFNVSAYNG